MTKKEQAIIELAQKGGKDTDLFLLDKIGELDNKLDTHIKEMGVAMNEMRNEMMAMHEKMTEEMDRKIESVKADCLNMIPEMPQPTDLSELTQAIKDLKDIKIVIE